MREAGRRCGEGFFSARVLWTALAAAFFFLGRSEAGAQIRPPEEGREVPPEVDEMYVKGLKYLVASQGPDGGWSSDGGYGNQAGVIGLAVVSMLAHGDDPQFGPYSQPVKKGIEAILKQANSENGYLGQSMYNHGFATLALAESYGVVDDKRIGPALDKAVKLILSAQKTNPNGAWRYSPESYDADTTVTGCQLVALFAARNAGLEVPDEAFDKGIKFLLSCQTGDGGIGYMNASGPNAARTAVGTLVLGLAKKKDSKEFRQAFLFLKDAQPEESSYLHYYLYYAAQALFRTTPQAWTEWNKVNIKNMQESQLSDGSWQGNFGKTFTTASSLLSLALNYRFLPIYER